MKTNPDDPIPDPIPNPVSDANIVSMFEDATTEISPSGEDLTASQDVEDLVKRTVKILRQGTQSSRKGLKEIFEGTLHLMDLQLRHSAQGARNDLFPHGKKSGFLRVLEEVGISPTTAYRWIERVSPFLLEVGITDSNFPRPDTEEWTKMVISVKRRVEHISGLGLPTCAIPPPKDEEILTRLRMAAAAGHEEAKQLLGELEAGETTIVEATRRYCMVEKAGKRPPPALLKLNPKTMEAEGRSIKAIGVVEELFAVWEKLPVHVRLQARPRIREMLGKLPKDCEFLDS